MASSLSLSHQFLCTYSSETNQSSKTQPLTRTPKRSLALRTLLKSTSPKNSSTSLQSSPEEPNPIIKKPKRAANRPDPSPPSQLSLFNSPLFIRLRRLRDESVEYDGIVVDILSIALPAALALAADPIASLIDTAFVGHLGSVELAAVGVSASVFNLVSKLFNVPLLNITTSFVAEEQALVGKAKDGSQQIGDDCQGYKESKKLLPSASTSLALAASIGIAEAVALFLGSGVLMDAMGICVDSPMRIPAEQFLSLRAFGAPPIVIALAAQGTFRGFKDTKTPLYAICAGNALNAVLDGILIFIFNFGIGGAAVATVISEYLIAAILLWKLNTQISLIPTNIDGRRIVRYLKSGGLLIGRTLAVVVTTTLATSMAAREGPVPMAGHQICIQVWLAVSLLTDALALAGQTLLASGYSQKNYEEARQVVYKALQLGLVMGIGLSGILFIGFKPFSGLFSTDTEVLAIACSGLLITDAETFCQFVAGSQPFNAIAFVLDGLYYGVSDFEFAAYSMVLVGLTSSVFILLAAPVFGLAGIWAGLFLFMALRVIAGIWRLGTKSGPWKLVWDEGELKS
ncbi:protein DETOXIFICATION 44, chloroplastic isoform X1 [Rosa chinensis]|uniref:protein DETOXIFICATION 44, chloroplastic isoform X1 n=1 Tax=Rosa chinensis TaxID=74649 RepID=UPI001AD8C8C2|nr:protein DETOXIFICATION 44, chloroplastic isoform X1 [Rosa chinensis]